MFENTATQKSPPLSEQQALASIYKNKLLKCGLTHKQASKLLASKSLEEIRAIAAQLKQNCYTHLPANNAQINPDCCSNRTLESNQNNTARVKCAKPSLRRHPLSCSRKRTKVEQAIKNGRLIRRDQDPLRHLGLKESNKEDKLAEIVIF